MIFEQESKIYKDNAIQKALEEVEAAATQYTWHTEADTGAWAGTHITLIPQDQFLADPANGGFNVLINSLGTYIRDGLTTTAFYGASTRVGGDDGSRVDIRSDSVAMYDNNNTLGFIVEAGTDTGDVQISEFAQAFVNIRKNQTATYTLNETPVNGTRITLEVDSYAFSGGFHRVSFTAGTSETKTETISSTESVTFVYTAPNTIIITNNTADIIYTGQFTYTAHKTNAKVSIPASLDIQGTDFTKALFNPALISTGITSYSNRASLESGGYFDIGKWRYVDIQIDITASSLGTNNTWALLEGFATPANYYAALSSARVTNGNTVGGAFQFYINGSGRLCVSTAGTALTQTAQLVVTGWYMKA